MTKSFQPNDSRILLKLITTDTIENTVFNTIKKMDSMLVFRVIWFVVTLFPKKYLFIFNRVYSILHPYRYKHSLLCNSSLNN